MGIRTTVSVSASSSGTRRTVCFQWTKTAWLRPFSAAFGIGQADLTLCYHLREKSCPTTGMMPMVRDSAATTAHWRPHRPRLLGKARYSQQLLMVLTSIKSTESRYLMKTALKNNSWITTVAFALIEFPIIVFLSYFSLGSKDDIIEIYHSDPSRIIFIRGCFSFFVTSVVMTLMMLLYAVIKRFILNVMITCKRIWISLALNFVIIGVEVIVTMIYKLMTRGYI